MQPKPKYYEAIARTPEEQAEHIARLERIKAFRAACPDLDNPPPPASPAWQAYDRLAFGGAQ